MKTWDAPTLARFLALVRDDRHQPAWLFLATTSCRRGEALGLRWTDVDLDIGNVVIYQTVSAIDHDLRTAPRTKSGKPRPIGIDAATVAALRAVRKRQAQERLLLGPRLRRRSRVRPARRPPAAPRTSRTRSSGASPATGCPASGCTISGHTWATLALAAGVDVKIVSERLGHTSAKITWDIYQHVTPTMQTDAAETVARLIFGTPGTPG